SKRLAHREQEGGTKPFAAAEQTPTDRGVNTHRLFGFFRDQTIKLVVNQRATRSEKFASVVCDRINHDGGHRGHRETGEVKKYLRRRQRRPTRSGDQMGARWPGPGYRASESRCGVRLDSNAPGIGAKAARLAQTAP